jgi:hypothetical protein
MKISGAIIKQRIIILTTQSKLHKENYEKIY